MATNIELRNLFGDGVMLRKVQASISKIAYEIASGGDTGAPYDQAAGAHDKRIEWLVKALGNPSVESKIVWQLILGKNEAATVSQITGATDSTVDSNAREVVDALAEALSIV